MTNTHHPTQNNRGVMHPLSDISQRFVLFAAKAEHPVMDMGCAYGNTVIEALHQGAKRVIACDMEPQHLAALRDSITDPDTLARLETQSGKFPQEFVFDPGSISAIHISHVLEFLSGVDIEVGLRRCFEWLHSGGRLFLITYSIYIKELAHAKFTAEYQKRLAQDLAWPGYFEQYNEYVCLPDNDADAVNELQLPDALHMFDIPHLTRAMEQAGFTIESADYLDGKRNGAVPETWHDGREYVGIIASKP